MSKKCEELPEGGKREKFFPSETFWTWLDVIDGDESLQTLWLLSRLIHLFVEAFHAVCHLLRRGLRRVRAVVVQSVEKGNPQAKQSSPRSEPAPEPCLFLLKFAMGIKSGRSRRAFLPTVRGSRADESPVLPAAHVAREASPVRPSGGQKTS